MAHCEKNNRYSTCFLHADSDFLTVFLFAALLRFSFSDNRGPWGQEETRGFKSRSCTDWGFEHPKTFDQEPQPLSTSAFSLTCEEE